MDKFFRYFIVVLLIFGGLLLDSTRLQAQVNSYNFAQNIVGYTPLTGGTAAFAAPWDNNTALQVPIGFTFNYDGTDFTQCFISPNGFITLGVNAPLGSNFIPLSNAAVYNPGNTGGAIAPMGGDWISNGSPIEYGIEGTAPNRTFVVQWTNANRKSGTVTLPGDFDFQIRLSETSHTITFAYGNCDTTQSTTTYNVQVGLRGFDNVIAQGNVFNRIQGSSQIWGNVGATSQGFANTASLLTNPSAYPNFGLQFIFSPTPPCNTPTALPTGLVIGATSINSSSFVGNSFIAPTPAPSRYLIVRSLSPTPPTSAQFVNRTFYAAGTTVGAYTVIANTNLTTFTQTGLAPNTTYHYWVIPFNEKCLGAPFYNLSSPLYASATTCFTTAVATAATAVGGNDFVANWNAVAGATSYSIDVSTNNTFTAILPSYNNFNVPVGTTSLNVTGLLPFTTYFYRVRANGPGCILNSGTITLTTTCGFFTIPYLQNFDTTAIGALPNCFVALNNNSDAQAWNVQSTTFSSAPRSVIINRNTSLDMNDWLMGPGLNLTGGVSYRLIFRYNTGAISATTENLTVFYGSSQTVAGMTNNLISLTGINNSFFETVTIDFVPATSGVYYLGFRGSSIANQSYLALDDISVTLSPSCIDPTNLAVGAIGSTTASIEWTASTTPPSGGYEYFLSTTATPPTAATTPTGSVGPGVTTLNLTGLIPSTFYWIWVRGNCGPTDKSVWTAEETFNTECSTPTVTSTIPVTRCGFGNGTLTATPSAGATIRWYDSPVSGSVIATGNTLTTPNTSTNLTYFAEARSLGAIAKLGPSSPIAQSGIRSVQTIAGQIDFTVTSITTLLSVDIFPMVSGQTGRIIVRTNTNIPLTTINYTTAVSGGNTLQAIPINIPLDPGMYNLFFETLPASGLRMNTTNSAYPYTSAVATLDGNSIDPNFYLAAYNWRFTTQCLSPRVPVTLSITAPPALTLSQSSLTICEGETTAVVTVSGAGAYNTFTWTPNTGVSGSAVAGYTFNPTVTTTYTLVANQTGGSLCGNLTSITINVRTAPPTVAILPVNPTVCENSIVPLLGTTSLATPSVVLFEGFDGPTNNWVVANSSTGGTPLNSQFTLRPSGYNYINAFGWNVTFASPTGTQFYLANSDSQSTETGSVTRTTLTSPVFSLAGYTTAQLQFAHYIRFISADRFWVQVSPDGGTTWTTIQSYLASQGGPASFSNVSLSLGAYLGMTNLRVRFNYESNWGYCWAIDSVSINGSLAAALTWEPTTFLFSDPAATIPYVSGTPASVVYTKPLSTITYNATLTGSNGCIRVGTSTITVAPATNPGVLGSSQLVCSSATPDNLVLTGNVGNIIRWESADDPAFTVNIATITNTTNTLTPAQMGVINPIKYYRVVVQSSPCTTSFSNIVSVALPVTTWNGTAWSNGVPNANVRAIFAGNFTSTGNITACSVRVNSGAIVFSAGHSLVVTNNVVVAGGSLTFLDTASLVQISDLAVNTGAISYRRTTTPMRRFDFTYWSSPVATQVLNVLSALTLSDKFFIYNPTLVNWVNVANTSTMVPGAGYIIRAPNNFSITAPTVFNANFVGVPNNGVFNVPVLNSTTNFNLIGNPYPSAVSADALLSHPSNVGVMDGTLYFWTHNTPMINNGYTNNDYAIYNYLGGTGTSAAVNPGVNTSIPNGKIAAGQGFFMKALSSGNVLFNNSMRLVGDNNQFFRMAQAPTTNPTTAHRYWLEVTNTTGAYKQALIGYAPQATLGIDRGFDSDYLNVGLPVALYSVLPGNQKLSIQGRPMPFEEADQVSLGFTAATSEDYTIRLSAFDGLFTAQDIFLRDKYLEVLHDLKQGPYQFRSVAGTFDDRFVIVYRTSALNTTDFDSESSIVLYHTTPETITVAAQKEPLALVKVYDVRGALLETRIGEGATSLTFQFAIPQQVLLFEITTTDGRKVMRKYVR
ncbi:MAG: choice-of-anchor J domain-containing protein [Flavobacterium sp.]|uniref:choice-of-anchor J domain-containing protein n=1 Tax=Flavobacterium sp. TaxID=239 RepID=UPI0022C90859|nr:choice-of-anchor J domain-containing protein [Flavobacterium sp.]MCZ8298546.1 choice-of-anchor J domain-containing protein [Flavobacterium sp.]